MSMRRYAIRKSEDSQVRPDPHRAEADVNVGEGHGEQAAPRKQLVLVVQRRRTRVGAIAERVLRHLVMRAARMWRMT